MSKGTFLLLAVIGSWAAAWLLAWLFLYFVGRLGS